MDANRPAPGPGGYGGLGAGSIVSKNIQPLLEADPRQIGPYAVRGRLGQGAMGSVYLGFAPSGQAFALKVLRQDFASDRDFRKRFTREIAAARAVHSPFVNAVTDADPNAATPWLASYFIPGPPLSSAVQLAGPFAPRSVAHLGVGIGLALQAIHTAGIVHRDLKPANVLVASDGPRVIDFGIARAVDASMLTATGMRLGTPSFMAPEQVAGSDVDAPADVWAVGGMLIYAATGRTPFGDGNAMAILYRVENHEPDLQGMEPALAYIAGRCLTKDPAERPTPTQLVEMCRAALNGGLEGHPALRGSDVTGWLPSAVSRDLAARAVELANIGHVVPGPGPVPAAAAPATASPSAGGVTGTGTGAGGAGKTGGGLGGFLRRKGGGPAGAGSATGAPSTGQPSGQYSQGTAMGGGQGQYGQPSGQTGGGQYGPPPGYEGQDPNGTGGGGTGQIAPGHIPPGQMPQGQMQPGQMPPGQYGAQQQGTFGGQNPGGTGGQYGAPAPQQGYANPEPAGQWGQPPQSQQQQSQWGQPAAPAWGPSGPSGSDMPTTITPPNVPAPEPQEPAWRAATSSQTPAAPEPEPAGVAGLPAGFTPIGEEARRLEEVAEADSAAASDSGSGQQPAGNGPAWGQTPGSGFGQQSASGTPAWGQPGASDAPAWGQPAASDAPAWGQPAPALPQPAASAASDVDPAFGPPKPANSAIPQIAEPTFATNFNIPAVTPQPEAGADSGPARSGIGVPSIAEPTFATNFNIPAVTPQPEPAADQPQATPSTPSSTPAPAPSFAVPQIAEPTFATNFNIPAVTPAPAPDAAQAAAQAASTAAATDAPASQAAPSTPPPTPPPAPAPSFAIPQIAEPTFATNFNMPAVTPQSGAGDSSEPEASAPAAPFSGISVPQIAEPTFATNFNMPAVSAAAPNADSDTGDAPSARTGPPAVSVPSIAEPSWATGFMPAVTPDAPAQDAIQDAIPSPIPDEPEPAPKPITHAPPIPPHLQQPMTPPKGFGTPSSTPSSQQQPQSPPFQQQTPAQQPFAPPQQGQGQGQGQYQQPYAAGGYAQQPQPPFAQQPPAPQPQHGYQQQSPQAYQQPYQPQPPQSPQAPHPQQQFGYQQPQASPQQSSAQQYAGYQQPPAYQQPSASPQQPPAQHYAGYQQQPPAPQQHAAYQQQPPQPPQPSNHPGHPGHPGHPNQAPTPRPDHNPQAGGMTIVPLPPSMESPYGVPERPQGPGPTLVDTGTAKGWSSWSSSKRIIVLTVAGIVVVGGIVGAILAMSGGSSKSGAPVSPAVGNAAHTTGGSPTTTAAAGPIGAQQGAPGARDVVLRGLYVAAADRDFQTVCSSQTAAAQKGAAKSAGWDGQGDPMALCEKYFQDNWSTISADYLRGRQVTDVKTGPAASTMTVTVNDPPPSGGGSTRSFTVVWQDTHWLLEAANA